MKKLALITGINYRNSGRDSLNGCINDASAILKKLVEDFDFKKSDIQLLIEEVATRKNILEGLEYLVEKLEPGDIGVFTYAGHGTQTVDLPPIDEDDMKDEAIVPIDAINDHSNLIRDDEFQEILSQLKPNVHFVLIFDSCHSETITRDLRNSKEEMNSKLLSSIEKVKNINELQQVINEFSMREINSYKKRLLPPSETINEIKSIMSNIKGNDEPGIRVRRDREHPLSGPNHILLAGCKADQASLDDTVNGVDHGLFSIALVENMKKGITYKELFNLAYNRVQELTYSSSDQQYPQLEGPDDLLNKKIFE